jgi:hypothetical protein
MFLVEKGVPNAFTLPSQHARSGFKYVKDIGRGQRKA